MSTLADVPRGSRRPTVLLAVVLGLGILLSCTAITRHRLCRSTFLDLGYQDNICWNLAQGHWFRLSFIEFGSSFYAHFSPISWLFAQAYRILPSVEVLLTLQSLGLASGIVPFFLLGRRALGTSRGGWFLAAAYVSHPSVYAWNQNDVHPVVFAAPLLAWLLVGFLEDRPAVIVTAAVLACACKEEVPLTVASTCLVAAVCWPARRRLALVMAGLAFAYLVLVLRVLLPWQVGIPNLPMFESRFGHLGATPIEALGTIVRHPLDTLRASFTLGKLKHTLLFLAPSAGFVVLAPEFLLPALPAYAYSYLSRMRQVHLMTHYAALLLPFVLAALGFGVARGARRLGGGRGDAEALWRRRLMVFALGAHAALWFGLGGVTSWDSTMFTERSTPAAMADVGRLIPPDASLWVIKDLFPQFAHRTFVSPYGRLDPRVPRFDYVLLDLRTHRQPSNPLGGPPEQTSLAPLEADGLVDRYRVVYVRDGLVLLKHEGTPDDGTTRRALNALRERWR